MLDGDKSSDVMQKQRRGSGRGRDTWSPAQSLPSLSKICASDAGQPFYSAALSASSIESWEKSRFGSFIRRLFGYCKK